MGIRSRTSTVKPGDPIFSLIEVYSGYVLTQSRRALDSVVMWESFSRFVAFSVLGATAAFWLLPGAENGVAAEPLKLALSGLLIAFAGALLWYARARPQYELRIDLIHCEVQQTLRDSGGKTRRLMTVPFSAVESLFIRRNPDLPQACALYMRIVGCDVPVLLCVSSADRLGDVHRRMSADLNKARHDVRMRDVQTGDARLLRGRLQTA